MASDTPHASYSNAHPGLIDERTGAPKDPATMAIEPPNGPLHLQRFLFDCNDALAQTVRSSVEHPISNVRSLCCECMPSGVMQRPNGLMPDSNRYSPSNKPSNKTQSSKRLAVPAAGADDERRTACRFFAVQTNDEEGVVISYCRRCEKKFVIYDRAMYWGVARKTPAPLPTYPYKCSCGSHAFEIAIGFSYPDNFLDENDLDTLTVAVRCASCNEVAIVFDDEAT